MTAQILLRMIKNPNLFLGGDDVIIPWRMEYIFAELLITLPSDLYYSGACTFIAPDWS